LAEQQADPTVRQLNAISQQLSGMDPQSQEAQALRNQFTSLERSMSQTPAESFMNPYQQQVIDESIRQINRQGDISRQNLQAQATRAGAFGGSREGVQRAELERALSEQRNAAIVGGLSQGYQSAAQQAQQQAQMHEVQLSVQQQTAQRQAVGAFVRLCAGRRRSRIG